MAAPSAAATTSHRVRAAEVVAARFIRGFESFSYRDPGGDRLVADLATPKLARQLRSSSQAAPGPELAAERFVVSAKVSSFAVEEAAASTVRLLAHTSEHISTRHGSTTSARLVPVSLSLTSAGWRVADVSGIHGSRTVRAPRNRTAAQTTLALNEGSAATSDSIADVATADTDAASVVRDVGGIPSEYLSLTQAAAAAECPGLPWEVLAGIARVESDFGESTLPGVSSGANYAGAEGPMQFEPATFRAYGIVAPDGAAPASPYDPADAVYSAARMLCADGGGTPGLLDAAIFDYNHSDAYVSLVLAYAGGYDQEAAGTSQLSDASESTQGVALGSVVVADAEAYLGTPYVWGGEQPGVGFDCSGLVQWVYAEAGLSLPRVAQAQYDAGPLLPAGATLYPGDLVFFGSGPDAVEHVGIYVGNGEMIDAPYTGVDVRFDAISSVSLGYVGATRPDIPNLVNGAGVPVVATTTVDLSSYAPSATAGSTRSDDPGGPSATPRRGAPVTGAAGVDHPHPKKGTTPPKGGATSPPLPVRRSGGSGSTTTTSIATTTSTVPGRKVPPITTTTVPLRKVPPTTTTTTPTTTTMPTTPTMPTTITTRPPTRTPPSTAPPTTTPTTTRHPTTSIPTAPTTAPSPPAHRRDG